jgi:hypothetical protein
MKNRFVQRRVLVWISLLGITASTLLGAAVPMNTLETAFLGRAQNMLQQGIPGGQVIATRDLTNAALAILAAGGSPAQAQQLLTVAFSVQNMNTSSPTYGSFPWYYNSNAVTDENADDFTSQALGPIWLHYGQLFPATFQSQMLQHLQATIGALTRRIGGASFGVSYTNIFLMDTVSLLLIGQSVGDVAAVQAGTQMLQQWNTYTLTSGGIYEYGTSTYYSIDLDSLVMGFLYYPPLHSTFQTILDYFWTDIKANYFFGQQDLSGAHSRDYDFLYGHGGLLYYLWTEGLNSWFTTDLNLVEMGQVYVLENGLSNAGYHPNWNSLPGSSDNSPKWIVQTTSTTTLNADRENYVTPDFALGSASANYGPQDKLINLKLTTTKSNYPDISIVPDTYDAPYGMVVAPDSQGHLKPVHQLLNPASVQKGGLLLTVLDLDPALAGNVSNFATNILLPAKADSISVDGTNVNLSTPTQIPLSEHSWIGVREGQAAVLMRLFRVDALNGVPPQIILQSDAIGLSYGAARITAYHYQGNPAAPVVLSPTHLKVGLEIIAYHCASTAEWNSLLADAQASLLSETEPSGTWEVQVQVPGPEGGYVEILRNLVNRQTFTRTGGGE